MTWLCSIWKFSTVLMTWLRLQSKLSQIRWLWWLWLAKIVKWLVWFLTWKCDDLPISGVSQRPLDFLFDLFAHSVRWLNSQSITSKIFLFFPFRMFLNIFLLALSILRSNALKLQLIEKFLPLNNELTLGTINSLHRLSTSTLDSIQSPFRIDHQFVVADRRQWSAEH